MIPFSRVKHKWDVDSKCLESTKSINIVFSYLILEIVKMERLSGRQPLNWSVMEVEAVIEMQSVGRKEDQNCNETSNPPMLDRNDDDNEKSK